MLVEAWRRTNGAKKCVKVISSSEYFQYHIDQFTLILAAFASRSSHVCILSKCPSNVSLYVTGQSIWIPQSCKWCTIWLRKVLRQFFNTKFWRDNCWYILIHIWQVVLPEIFDHIKLCYIFGFANRVRTIMNSRYRISLYFGNRNYPTKEYVVFWLS